MSAAAGAQAARRRGSAPITGDAGGQRTVVYVLTAIVVAAAALRFATLGVQSLWLDEALTHRSLQLPFAEMVRHVSDTEGNPPLYYIIAWLWTRAFGSGDIGLRSLSALAGTLTVPVAYLVGRRLVGRAAGLAATALVAFNPFLIWFSQEARSYALVVLLCALSMLLFVAALRGGGRRELAGWAVVSALALATHYFAVFLVGPELLVLVWRRRGDAATLVASAVVAAAGGALLPLAIAQRATGRAEEVASAALSTRLEQIPKQFLAGYDSPAPALVAALGLALVLAAGALALRGDARTRRGAAIAAGLGVGVVVLPALLALAGLDYVSSRYVTPAIVPFAVAAGAGFALPAARPLGLALAGLLCALWLFVVIAVDADPAYQRPDWGGAARALGPAARTRLVVASPVSAGVPLSVYRPGLRAEPLAGTEVEEIDVLAVEFKDGPGAAASIPRPAWPTPPPVPGFRETARVLAPSYAIVRYRSPRPVHVTPAQLAGSELNGNSYVVLVQRPAR